MRNKFKTYILILSYTAVFSFSLFSNNKNLQNTPSVPNYTLESDDIIVSARADDIRWRYKLENGKLYMRLFNYSANCWIGDWILCE